MQQNQLEHRHDCNRHGHGNEIFIGQGSAGTPVIAGTDMPGASTEAGQLGRHSNTASAQDSKSAQQQQLPSIAAQQKPQLAIAPHEGMGGLCRKPGRGDTTLSMSCSDKLAKWGLLGVQVCTCDLLTQLCIKVLLQIVMHCVSLQYWGGIESWAPILSV